MEEQPGRATDEPDLTQQQVVVLIGRSSNDRISHPEGEWMAPSLKNMLKL
ncbi:hypothetical protein [Mucilaginibacter sp. HD30]